MRIAIRKANLVVSLLAVAVLSVTSAVGQASSIPNHRLINPEDLVKLLQTSGKEKPLMIQVGSHVLFSQAHIPGSEYIGPASSEAGLQQLRKRVESLPRAKFIVLYCGCCPWGHCPNVKVLYISDNFGTNWVDKGYPVAKGE
jgi:thiosulfate/3-mercaptopyruvate sulfurtransferase